MKTKGIFIVFFTCLALNGCEINNNIFKVKKISIEYNTCEKNCICLSSFKINYFFESNFLLKKNDLKLKLINFNTFKLIKMSSETKDGLYLYQFVFDNFDMSKYRTLNQIKKDYKSVIYFNKLETLDSDLLIESNQETIIQYMLNGQVVHENDTTKMNFPPIERVIFNKPGSQKF
ncbi:hypothetical protein SAMN05444377_10724 [Flavobacterium fontis]|uniref:Uncharacterized protein n=1 Tax=Flavobacterium fontis TaxID=1124188 RepID=A0A1M5AWR7_9FLAO|nr:hypothetical protein [Flavobacterium fontis]SHF34688.1 hypothetical protein SAMN05444377_10724 [Flavobacterium fontis]